MCGNKDMPVYILYVRHVTGTKGYTGPTLRSAYAGMIRFAAWRVSIMQQKVHTVTCEEVLRPPTKDPVWKVDDRSADGHTSSAVGGKRFTYPVDSVANILYRVCGKKKQSS